ncbi:MAG: hypothetical protein ACOCZS_00260 [Verrucomicrobiota bacterium]
MKNAGYDYSANFPHTGNPVAAHLIASQRVAVHPLKRVHCRPVGQPLFRYCGTVPRNHLHHR